MSARHSRIEAPILVLLALSLILLASPAEGQGGRVAPCATPTLEI